MVLDTNVLLDALLFDNAEVRPLWCAITGGEVQWLTTPPMLDEFLHQLGKPALARYEPKSERMLKEAQRAAVLTPPAPALPPSLSRLRCRDRDDQPFIDLAWWHRASLISRDRDLLSLARKARPLGLVIVAPRDHALRPVAAPMQHAAASALVPQSSASAGLPTPPATSAS